jgi:MFS family permease
MTSDDSGPGRPSRLLKFRLQDLGLNFLPGLLGGAQVAGLLFFLNPDLPFSWWLLLRTGILFGLGCGAISALIFSLFTWRRPGRARRQLPWAVVAILAAAAIVAWVEASQLGFFLAPGITRRLIKAAIGLSILSLACFYTALLHVANARAYGRRSIALFLVTGILSIYLLGERRKAFQPRLQATPLPAAVEIQPRVNLVVVGLTGATLDAILPLAEQGQLPFFLRLIEEGAYGRLTSLPPTSPEALWTSLATGRFPYHHGVLGRWSYRSKLLFGEMPLRLLPGSPLVRDPRLPGFTRERLDSRLRRNPALWEIFDRLGVPSGTVGWPATSPVRGSPEFMFSELYFRGDFSASSALPPELAERGVLFKVEGDALDPAALSEFGEEVPYEVLRAIADDYWRQTLTLFLIEQRQETRALFLLLPGLGSVSERTFGGYSAQLDGHQEDRNREAARLLTAYYRNLDGFLEQIWNTVPGNKILAVASPFGITESQGWRRLLKSVSGRTTEGTYRPTSDGILFLLGEGVKPNQFLEDAGVLDVMPTLLYAAGCPIGRDLDGRVLISAFDNAFLAQNPLTFVPSYEVLGGETTPPPG